VRRLDSVQEVAVDNQTWRQRADARGGQGKNLSRHSPPGGCYGLPVNAPLYHLGFNGNLPTFAAPLSLLATTALRSFRRPLPSYNPPSFFTVTSGMKDECDLPLPMNCAIHRTGIDRLFPPVAIRTRVLFKAELDAEDEGQGEYEPRSP
jgi:hypothetical protein